MSEIYLGANMENGLPVYVPTSAFSQHLHGIGGTGKGKTTGLTRLLHELIRNPWKKSCFFIIDRMGNFSDDLLTWIASPDYCTDYVRDRLVYLEPAREDVVMPLNPLLYTTQSHGYFCVERTTEIILRAWESSNLEGMPRLARWTFNAFWAAAQMGLTVSDCAHLLSRGSDFHAPLMKMLPKGLQYEWQEVLRSSPQDVTRLLESTRNRMQPYFQSDVLRRLFGSSRNHFDVRRFILEGKVVIVNLNAKNKISGRLANTLGSLMVNEVVSTVRSLEPEERNETYMVLDECQRFVGPDLEEALPETRQLNLRFILMHQFMDQLVKGDYDLMPLIFQAQSRMVFGVQGKDADILAQEFASLNFDPKRVKDELRSRRQMQIGNEIIELNSWSDSEQAAANWSENYGDSTNKSTTTPAVNGSNHVTDSVGRNKGTGKGGSKSSTRNYGTHQSVIPVYEQHEEVSGRTFMSFDEQQAEWAKEIRTLKTGEALLRIVDQDETVRVAVERSSPGYLEHDILTLNNQFQKIVDLKAALIEKNFSSDLFLPASQIDRETEERIQQVCFPKITVQTDDALSQKQGQEGGIFFA